MSRALIVVDVQRDFCEGGALAVEGGAAVAGEISATLGRTQISDQAYAVVLATRDHHIDPGAHFSDRPDFVDSWPPHCVVGTEGVESVDVCGIATDYCVRATALDAARAGLDTTVLLTLTAAVSAQNTDRVVGEFRAAGITVAD